jgi:hypothetical protein
MTQPAREHRREIYARLCLSYGVISDILWRDAMDTHHPVGNCSRCPGLMKPREPQQRGRRMFYEAYCALCGHEVEGQGPRPAKQQKGAA